MATTAAGGVTWEGVGEEELAPKQGGSGEAKPKRNLKISIPKWCGKWVVGMDGYADGVVGAKSKNLAGETLQQLLASLEISLAILELLSGAPAAGKAYINRYKTKYRYRVG